MRRSRRWAPPRVEDDRARNVLVVSESYEVPAFWKHGRRELQGWAVDDHLPRRVAATRPVPLAVPHPAHVRHEVVVRADAPFHVGPYGETVSGKAFAFTSTLARKRNEVTLTFDYRSLADAVGPEDMKSHTQEMARLEDQLSFLLLSDLTSPDAPEDGWTETTLAGGAVSLALAAVLSVVAVVRVRRRRAGRNTPVTRP